MPFRLSGQLLLQGRNLQPDHRAAEHGRLQAHLARRAHHTGGVDRIRGDEHQVGLLRLDGAHDRAEIDRIGRILVVVDDLEAKSLGVGARAFQRVIGKLDVRAHQRDGLGARVELGGDLEKAQADRRFAVRPVGHGLEEFAVVELVVHCQRKAGQDQPVALHRQRHRRRGEHRAQADQHVHLVDVEQLGDNARHRRGIRLVVIDHQLDLAAQEAAARIDLLGPDLQRHLGRLADRAVAASERMAPADLDRVSAKRRARERGQHQEKHQPENLRAAHQMRHGLLLRYGLCRRL